MNKILVTGTSGFVGAALSSNLSNSGSIVIGAVRSQDNLSKILNKNLKIYKIGDIDSKTDWSDPLNNAEYIIHCAGVTNIKKIENDKLNECRLVNVEGTSNLAEQAARRGIKRFIFLSSIKVNGERTFKSKNFKYNDTPMPEDAYAISKWEAEKILWEISARTGLEVVIIRAPLIYGPGVKGNFLNLLNLIAKKIPLPLLNIYNLRSFVGIDNLIDLIICCITSPGAPGNTFLVSDNEDISTPDLINKIAKIMGKTHRLIPFPIFLLNFTGIILNKSSEIERLTGSLQVDISHTIEKLGWRPPESLDKNLCKMVKWYLNKR